MSHALICILVFGTHKNLTNSLRVSIFNDEAGELIDSSLLRIILHATYKSIFLTPSEMRNYAQSYLVHPLELQRSRVLPPTTERTSPSFHQAR